MWIETALTMLLLPSPINFISAVAEMWIETFKQGMNGTPQPISSLRSQRCGLKLELKDAE